ncbi:MAG: ABC transporter substrate-binding protein [Candidatus Limnocylindrales bacterium]
MRRMLAMLAAAAIGVGACSTSTGGTTAPSTGGGASSAPASSAPSTGAGGFDPAAIEGDLVLQGWSAGAVEAPILEKLLVQFQAAYPKIKVKFEPVAGEYPAAMAAKFSSGDVPDVFYVDSAFAPTWIDDQLLAPLDDYIAKSAMDTSQFYEGYLNAFKGPDGKIYGLPKDGNTLGMAYNTDMLTKAGVTAPPTSWEELTAAAEKLTVSGVKSPMCLSSSLDRALAFIYQGGGALFSDDKTASAIESPESVAAIDAYLGFFKSGAGKRPGDLGVDWCGQALGEKKAAIIFEGGWVDPYMKDQFPDTKYAWAEMPAGKGGKATMGFTVSYSMGADSKNKDASWVLISYLTGKDGMTTWTEGGVANPSRKDVAGAPGKEILIQAADYARPWSFIPGFSKVNDAFNNAMTAAIESGGTGQSVADATKAAIDAALK